MKVLVTPEFTESVKHISSEEMMGIARLFHAAEKLEFSELLSLSEMQLFSLDDQKIYVMRFALGRIYCIVEQVNGEDTLIFINYEKKISDRSDFLDSFVEKKRSSK